MFQPLTACVANVQMVVRAQPIDCILALAEQVAGHEEMT
jgi:hypothetical protein